MKLLLVLLAFGWSTAFAQAYPSKPLRWIVPTGPGSAVDVNARRVAPKLGEALGQPVIVENRPGANSMIGAREAARAAPDGYTLFQAVVNNAINDALAPDPCCVLNDRLVPVTRLYITPLVLVVHPGVPARTLQEYVALARAKPGSLTYASVPYKAIGAEVPDLTGGHVASGFLAPDVPTMAEGGYPVVGPGWNGLFVPAGTPRPIVERLQKDTARVLQLKEIREDATTLGTLLGGESPEEFAAFVRAEVQTWGKVIKEANIK